MKIAWPLLLLGCLLPATAAQAQAQPQAQTNVDIQRNAADQANEVAATQASPLLGSWSLDTSQMDVPFAYRPKSVIITFADLGGDKWSTRVTITDKEGGVRDMTSAYQRTGAAVPIEGDQMEADTVAVVTPANNVMVLALAKDKHPASTRIYVVSADGQSMTEQAVNWGGDGVPVIRTNHFKRAII